MKLIGEKIAKLIDLKSIITMIVTIGLLWGFMNNKITDEQFMQLAIMVFTFYFTRPKENKDEGRG